MQLEIDTERLRREAETLGAQRAVLDQANTEITTGCSTGEAGCGNVADGGLAGAIRHLRDAWHFDVEGMISEIATLASVMTSLVNMYSAADIGGADALE